MRLSPTELRLLLVEDNDEHAALVIRQLKKVNTPKAIVDRANSAEEGLAMTAGKAYDVILLDLSLPDSQPEKTLKSFTQRFPSIAIIVLTSLAEAELIQDAITLGAQDYLEKDQINTELMFRAIRYAMQRKASYNQLTEQNENLRRFSHTVAHELKSPLQGVVTALHIIREMSAQDMTKPVQQLLELGIESASHLENIITELLALAEATSEKSELEDVDLDKLTLDVIHKLRGEFTESDIAITIPDPLPVVKGNPLHLRQVMRNLIENALKYRAERSLKVEITSEQEADGTWIFRVKDNGLGIAEENLERVFDTFFRVHSREEIPGTGIGLGFIRQLLEMHGGEITAESKLGEGSTFQFRLPSGEEKS